MAPASWHTKGTCPLSAVFHLRPLPQGKAPIMVTTRMGFVQISQPPDRLAEAALGVDLS